MKINQVMPRFMFLTNEIKQIFPKVFTEVFSLNGKDTGFQGIACKIYMFRIDKKTNSYVNPIL